MPNELEQPTRITLTGDALERIHYVVAVARQQLRAGQEVLDGRRLDDALLGAEAAIEDVAVRLRRAAEADGDDVDASGETDRQRQAWYPVYRAA